MKEKSVFEYKKDWESIKIFEIFIIERIESEKVLNGFENGINWIYFKFYSRKKI